MRRKRFWMSVALVIGFVLLVLIGLVAMIKSEPNFYAQALMPAGEGRKQHSDSAKSQYQNIYSALSDQNGEVVFSANEINGFLQEEFHRVGGDENLPEGVSDLRVKIEDGKMRLGFRLGKGIRSTIVALELRLWKVPGEINMLAMEVVSLQAGSLPLSTGTLLEYISETVRRENVEITWFRSEKGNPVAIMRFQADQTRPTFQFDAVELKDGKLMIKVRSMEFVIGPQPRVQK